MTSLSWRPWAAVLVLVLAGASPAWGQITDRHWIDSMGGSFTDTGNWSTGAGGSGGASVPTTSNRVHFRRGSLEEYSVTFPGKINFPLPVYEMNQLRVGDNSVTFSDALGIGQAPGTVNVTNTTTATAGRGIIVGENDADDDAVLTTTLAHLNAMAATVGDAPDSVGTLNVEGGKLTITGSSATDDELIISKQGYGELNVTSGGKVNLSSAQGSVMIAQFDSASIHDVEPQAQITVDGVGSELNVGGSLFVGFAALARVDVTGGGLLSTNSATIGEFNSRLIVEGEGSRWENAGNLAIGLTTGTGLNGLAVLDGGKVTTGGVFTVNDGILGVNGTIEGDVVNHGTVVAGNPSFGGSGMLHIMGDYEQDGELGVFAPNATGVSKVRFYGAVSLNSLTSSLNAAKFTNPPPHFYREGDEFDILDWDGPFTGTFHSITFPALLPSLTWDASDLYASGVIRVVKRYTADFDNDGDVDSGDLTQWGGDFGANGVSDADGDGDSDGVDFLTWQRQLGSGPPVAPTFIPVPEPATAALLVLAAISLRSVQIGPQRKFQKLVNAGNWPSTQRFFGAAR